MNHVADFVPPDLLPIPSLSSTPLPDPLSKPIKILMIHGHGSSSSRLFYKYRALQPLIRHEILHTLNRDVQYYFPNAPILPAGFEPGMWTWGLGDYRVDRVPGLPESIRFLVRYMEENGPFDGIVGSSAGASVAVLVGALLERSSSSSSPGGRGRERRRKGGREVEMVTTHPPLKFILSYSGFQMTHACYRSIYTPKIRTPVMHFIGELDTYIAGTLTLQLAQRCVNHEVVYFPGGHFIPRLGRTTGRAAGFICKCLVGGYAVGNGEGGRGEGEDGDDEEEWEWVEDGDDDYDDV